MLFKPVSETLTDELGSYTSDHFDSSNLYLVDNSSSLEVTVAGDKFTLFPFEIKILSDYKYSG